MIRGFYTASLGLQASQQKLNVHAHNIANADTPGFKSQTANFSDTLYTVVGDTALTGSGVKLDGVSLNLQQGNMIFTGEQLDFAIDGDGFFAVQNGAGETFLTRSGSFTLSLEDEVPYLVTAGGYYVLDANGNRIVVEDRAQPVPGMFTCDNPYGLLPVGDNLFAPTPESGQPYAAEGAELLPGYLEGATTDMVSEMSALLQTHRLFQLNAKMLQVSDEMEQTANTLR